MHSVRIETLDKDFVCLENVVYSGLQPDYPVEMPVYFFQLENGEQYEYPLSSILYMQFTGRYNPIEENKKTYNVDVRLMGQSKISISDVMYCGVHSSSLYYMMKKSGECYEIPVKSVVCFKFSRERLERKSEEERMRG